jgi:hypothetical protein
MYRPTRIVRTATKSPTTNVLRSSGESIFYSVTEDINAGTRTIDKMDWGPAGWKFLHSLTFAYPHSPTLEQQRSADSFFESLANLLPCDACQDHYREEFRLRPVDSRSQATLSSWLVDLHNRVNVRLNKPIVSYTQASQLYSSQCTQGCGTPRGTLSTSNTGEYALVILLVISAIALFFISKMNNKYASL